MNKMNSSPLIMTRLRESALANLRALEDLTKYQDRTQFFSVHEDDPNRFAYLLVSGHPSTIGASSPTVIMGGDAKSAAPLTKHLPRGPYTILETPKAFLEILEGILPDNSETYFEHRMELKHSKFNAIKTSRVRRLIETDDLALAEFCGAPPLAARGMRNWINGAACLLGIFEDSKLVSMGSSFSAIPEGWSLVGIKTKPNYRRLGMGAEVTSALCAQALEQTKSVVLTVLSDNAPAIALYQKLGFELKEERIWIDCGSGSKPFF